MRIHFFIQLHPAALKIIFAFIGTTIFSIYFYAIGSGYFSLFPLLFFLIWIGIESYYHKDFPKNIVLEYKHIFLGSWILINIAIGLLLSLLHIGTLETLLGIMACNMLAVILSYIIHLPYYHDISYITYFLSCLSVLCYAFYTPDLEVLPTLQYLIFFTIGFLAFLYFILPLYRPVSPYIKTHFVLSVFLSILCIIFSQIPNTLLAIFFALCCICLVLIGIYYISKQSHTPQQKQNISIRKILAGERILPHIKNKKNHSKSKIYIFFYTLVPTLPKYIRHIVEITNLGIFFFYLFSRIFNGTSSLFDTSGIHWGIVFYFLINTFLLKIIKYTSIIQKVSLFLGINITVYTLLFSLFSTRSDTLISLAIFWNFIYSILIFNLNVLKISSSWDKMDYITALLVDSLIVCGNIALLIQLPISGKIIFALSFLYITIKIMITLYTLNKIKRIFRQEKSHEGIVDTLI